MWVIYRSICRAEVVELSAVIILTKSAVPLGPSSPTVPWNSVDGNPCCHTALEDGQGQVWGEKVMLVANASFPWKTRPKNLPSTHRLGVSSSECVGREKQPAKSNQSGTLRAAEIQSLSSAAAQPESCGFPWFSIWFFSCHLLLWGSYGCSAPFSQPMWVHPREAPSQKVAQSHPGTRRTAGPGLPEAICRATGHLSGKCTTSALNLMWDVVFLYVTETVYLIVWQVTTLAKYYSLGLQTKEELIRTDFSPHSPEALIPLSRNSTSK